MAGYATIENILRESNLHDYIGLFQQNHVTDHELHILEEAHLKELGIPLGPRLKICSALRARGYPATLGSQSIRTATPSKLVPRGRPPGLMPPGPALPTDAENIPFSPQPGTCSACFRSVCICITNRPPAAATTTPDLSSIFEFSAFGSRSGTFSPFGVPPDASGPNQSRFSTNHGQVQSLFSPHAGESSLFSSLGHTSVSSHPHSLFSTGGTNSDHARTAPSHSLFSGLHKAGGSTQSLFSSSNNTPHTHTPLAQTQSMIGGSLQPPPTPQSLAAGIGPSKSAPSLFSSTSSTNIPTPPAKMQPPNPSALFHPQQTAAQTLFPAPNQSPKTTSLATFQAAPQTSPLLLAGNAPMQIKSQQFGQVAHKPPQPLPSGGKTLLATPTNALKQIPGNSAVHKPYPLLPAGGSTGGNVGQKPLLVPPPPGLFPALNNLPQPLPLSVTSIIGGYASNDSIWNENWASASSPAQPPPATSATTSKHVDMMVEKAMQERLREQEARAKDSTINLPRQEEGNSNVFAKPPQREDAKFETQTNKVQTVEKKKQEVKPPLQTPTKQEENAFQQQKKITKKPEPVRQPEPEKVMPRPPVATGNAFDLLNNESDDERASDKKSKKPQTDSEKKDVPKEKKPNNNTSSQLPSSAPSSSAAKPKCECGQIVHPSVLNPITEFQQQDRQAHLTSKRHQTYMMQQEVLAKKEREAKLKQEKVDAQKAKEDAQKAKEEAQKAIELAQRVIEEAEKQEDSANSAKEGKRKLKKKKERKISLVHPLGGEIIEENSIGDVEKVSASPADPKKKQLASEIQQEANQLYNKGLYAKAVERYSNGITLNPESAVLYSNRAQAYSKCSQYEKAVVDCQKSIELDPTFIKSYHRASACLIKLGDLKKAKQMLAQCHTACAKLNLDERKKDETPFHVKIVEDLEAALEEATKLMTKKHFDEAIDALQGKVCCHMPEAPLPNYLLAEAYIMAGDFLAADDTASKFMDRYPNMPETRILKALFAYYEEAKLDQAIEILKSVLVDDKENKKALQLLTRIQQIDMLKKTADEFHGKKLYPKAIECFTQALQVDRENECVTSTLLYCRAGVYFNVGQFAEAKKDLDEAIVYAGGYLKARRLRATVNEKLGDWQGVVEDCRFILDEEWDARCNEMLRSAKQNKPAQDYKGYYAALALPFDAKPDDIKKSYKKQILRWHPKKWANCTDDKRAEAELQFRAVAQAYEVLSDPVKRDKYDNFDYEDGRCECAGLEIFAFF